MDDKGKSGCLYIIIGLSVVILPVVFYFPIFEDFEDYILIFTLIVVVMLIITSWQEYVDADHQKKPEKEPDIVEPNTDMAIQSVQTSFPNLSIDFTLTNGCRIGIDENNNQLIVQLSGGDLLTIAAKDILGVSITENGKVRADTSVQEMIGGAALGGILFGGPGAIVGAMTASGASNVRRVNNVSLTILMNDMVRPSVKLNFLNKTVASDTSRHREALKQAELWHDRISLLVRRANLGHE